MVALCKLGAHFLTSVVRKLVLATITNGSQYVLLLRHTCLIKPIKQINHSCQIINILAILWLGPPNASLYSAPNAW